MRPYDMSHALSSSALAHIADLRRGGFSDGTAYNRTRAIARFRVTVGRDPRYATRAQWEAWWHSLDRLGAPARACELSHLRAYCRWLVRHGYLTTDPTERMDRPRLPQRLPRPATTEQVRQALAHVDGQELLIVLLGAQLGLRCVEIARLRWTDLAVNGDGTVALRIDGKGRKDRILEANGGLADLLRSRMRLRGSVVTGARGQELPAYRISHIGNRALRRAEVPVTMHQLRHWFGTEAERRTRDIVGVGQSMGHSSPRTTMVYVKVNAQRVRDVVRAVPDLLADGDAA